MEWLRDRPCFRALALLCSIAVAPGDILLFGQDSQQSQVGTQQNQVMTQDQLDSLAVPIAL